MYSIDKGPIRLREWFRWQPAGSHMAGFGGDVIQITGRHMPVLLALSTPVWAFAAPTHPRRKLLISFQGNGAVPKEASITIHLRQQLIENAPPYPNPLRASPFLVFCLPQTTLLFPSLLTLTHPPRSRIQGSALSLR